MQKCGVDNKICLEHDDILKTNLCPDAKFQNEYIPNSGFCIFHV